MKNVAAPQVIKNNVTSWRCQRKLNSFATVYLAAQVRARRVYASAARFFAAAAGEPLLGVFFSRLAKTFWVAGFSVRSNV